MFQTGTYIKCERCGREEFFADRIMLGDADDLIRASDWKRIDNEFVCSSCAALEEKGD